MSAILSNGPALTLEELLNRTFLTADSDYVRNVHCETSGSQIILRGIVPTAEIKQLAQNLVRQICGMREIANEIVVRNDS